jgi:hypothetical protein
MKLDLAVTADSDSSETQPLRFLPLLELASAIGVQPTTIRRWIWSGEVRWQKRSDGRGYEAAVPLPSGPGFVRASGPTASFSIGGFGEMTGGTTVFFCNATAFPMTVLHEYSGATAEDRIATPSGSSVIVQPGATVSLTRDGISDRWRLWWDQIEWTNVSGKPTAIARIQNMTGTYSSIDIAGATTGYAGIRFPDSYQDQRS